MPWTPKQKRMFYGDLNARAHGRQPWTSMSGDQLRKAVREPTRAPVRTRSTRRR